MNTRGISTFVSVIHETCLKTEMKKLKKNLWGEKKDESKEREKHKRQGRLERMLLSGGASNIGEIHQDFRQPNQVYCSFK